MSEVDVTDVLREVAAKMHWSGVEPMPLIDRAAVSWNPPVPQEAVDAEAVRASLRRERRKTEDMVRRLMRR